MATACSQAFYPLNLNDAFVSFVEMPLGGSCTASLPISLLRATTSDRIASLITQALGAIAQTAHLPSV